jgi:hypothetical protein
MKSSSFFGRLIILLFIGMTVITCKKDHLFDCVKSTGDEVTQVRKAFPFFIIDLKDNVDVIYRQDSVYRIKVTAGVHLIDGIITELNGNTLYIRNENRCNWVRSFSNKFTVEISAPTLGKVSMYGSGTFKTIDTIYSADFTCESWNASGSADLLLRTDECSLINHIGRADMNARGFSGMAFVYFNDTGVLDAGNLETNNCYIRSSTTGKCTVNVRHDLGAELRSVGDIYYYGSPGTITRDITGTGKLIPL